MKTLLEKLRKKYPQHTISMYFELINYSSDNSTDSKYTLRISKEFVAGINEYFSSLSAMKSFISALVEDKPETDIQLEESLQEMEGVK